MQSQPFIPLTLAARLTGFALDNSKFRICIVLIIKAYVDDSGVYELLMCFLLAQGTPAQLLQAPFCDSVDCISQISMHLSAAADMMLWPEALLASG